MILRKETETVTLSPMVTLEFFNHIRMNDTPQGDGN